MLAYQCTEHMYLVLLPYSRDQERRLFLASPPRIRSFPLFRPSYFLRPSNLFVCKSRFSSRSFIHCMRAPRDDTLGVHFPATERAAPCLTGTSPVVNRRCISHIYFQVGKGHPHGTEGSGKGLGWWSSPCRGGRDGTRTQNTLYPPLHAHLTSTQTLTRVA